MTLKCFKFCLVWIAFKFFQNYPSLYALMLCSPYLTWCGGIFANWWTWFRTFVSCPSEIFFTQCLVKSWILLFWWVIDSCYVHSRGSIFEIFGYSIEIVFCIIPSVDFFADEPSSRKEVYSLIEEVFPPVCWLLYDAFLYVFEQLRIIYACQHCLVRLLLFWCITWRPTVCCIAYYAHIIWWPTINHDMLGLQFEIIILIETIIPRRIIY